MTVRVRSESVGGPACTEALSLPCCCWSGGCAGGFGAPSAEASKTISQAKTVGVISAVGHKFALQKMGITVFGNELNEVAINSWGIDDAVANKISALLSKRYAVRRISHASGDLDAGAPDVIRKIAASQKHDLYVVVIRSAAPFGSSNQTVTGLGMIEAGGPINPDNVTLFAVTTVLVYDGRTFEQLGWQRTGVERGISMGKTINAPYAHAGPHLVAGDTAGGAQREAQGGDARAGGGGAGHDHSRRSWG